MESKKSKLPAGAIELYNVYIHGGMSRRDFLDGAQKLAIGGLTAAAIVEGLLPNYAEAQQVPKDDKRIKTEYATVPSPQGNGSIKGYLARPASGGKLPGVLVVHENRGLNPYIEDVARRLAVPTSSRSRPTVSRRSAAIRAMTRKAARRFDKSTARKWSRTSWRRPAG